MRRFVARTSTTTALAITIAALLASSASAATFYANHRGGTDTNSCKSIAEACETVAGAIKRAEAVPGPNTIELAAEGAFEEAIDLNNAADKGLTIVGEEPGVEIISKTASATVTVSAAAGVVTMSNLAVHYQTGTHAAVIDEGAALTLDDVTVVNESSSGKNGVESKDGGSVTINGGLIEMENGAKGFAALASETQLALNNVQIDIGFAAEDESGGVSSEKSGLSVQGTTVIVASGQSGAQQGILATKDGTVSLQNDTVRQNSPSAGVDLVESNGSSNGLTVMMEDSADKNQGVLSGPSSNQTFDHLNVSGTWDGVPFAAAGSEVTIADSHLTAAGALPSVEYTGSGENRGLLVQRSVLSSPANGLVGTLAAANGNVTVDSSEILGGSKGIFLGNDTGGTRTLTVSGSTIDAGAPGVAGDASTVKGVEAAATGGAASTTNANIEGSIVLEPQAATVSASNQASLTCSYTAAPNQTQATKGTEGAVNCAAGANGNTNSSGEVATLFSEPLTNYLLGPASSATDSVPTSAISLPFGLSQSGTDLNGNPRTRLSEAGGACTARQDKGAIESLTNPAPCPPPSPEKPTVGSITHLSISPNAFFAASSGATISKKKKAKKKYGATVSYRDSQVAIAKFTVLKPAPGRIQGKTCKKPSKKNRHGKRCTIYKSLGSFTRVDAAGANKFHFSGRADGQKLAKGTYVLQAVPHNAAGNGKTVSKQFKIK